MHRQSSICLFIALRFHRLACACGHPPTIRSARPSTTRRRTRTSRSPPRGKPRYVLREGDGGGSASQLVIVYISKRCFLNIQFTRQNLFHPIYPFSPPRKQIGTNGGYALNLVSHEGSWGSPAATGPPQKPVHFRLFEEAKKKQAEVRQKIAETAPPAAPEPPGQDRSQRRGQRLTQP